jgi:glycosyltransferase involved in cell wall biosynthesis
VPLRPRLTIGLPVYNGEKYLTASLDSLLGQSYEDFELIISDNASTDGTAEICRRYATADSRIQYFRQPHNIGCAPNHNFVISKASGELFKGAAHDDLYAPDLLQRCVEALDRYPHAVLAHSWSAVIDHTGAVTGLVEYPVETDAARASERLRSMLFDGWGDDESGVVRMNVLRRTPLHESYHFADRTFTAELALHGPFHIIPDRLYFRRQHGEQAGAIPGVRARCANLDPRRGNRLLHPVARLYAEYLLGYIRAVSRAPLSLGEKAECYRILTRWSIGRARSVAAQSLRSRGGRQLRQDAPRRRIEAQVSASPGSGAHG